MSFITRISLSALTLLAMLGCDTIDIGLPDPANRIVFRGRVTNEFDSGIRHARTWVIPRAGDCGGPLPRYTAPYGTETQHDGSYVMHLDPASSATRCYTLTALVGDRRHFDVHVWASSGDTVVMNIVVPESWGR
jgi:hypothetical protein